MGEAGEPSDEALFLRVQQGDDGAFRALSRRHASALRETVLRRLPPGLRRRVSLADVVQETHLVVLRRRLDFEDRGPDSFRRWLLGIADRKAREVVRQHLRARMRAANREVSRGLREDTGQFVGRQPTPSQEAMASELDERIQAAMEKLPEDYREVLHLTRQEGLSMREAALYMRRSREAVKKLYGRALCRFKEVFDELEAAGDG